MSGRRKSPEQPLVTLRDSQLRTPDISWLTSPSYQQTCLPFSATAFHSVNDALLENPNLTSSSLFRADIVFDSTGILKTKQEKEEFCSIQNPGLHLRCETDGPTVDFQEDPRPPLHFRGFEVRRTVLRRLIPRNPQRDRSLLQTCHIYTTNEENLIEQAMMASTDKNDGHEVEGADPPLDKKVQDSLLYKQSIAKRSHHLVVYQPHADPGSGSDVPWYHPPLKSLAFLCTREPSSDSDQGKQPQVSLSVHFQLFQGSSSTSDLSCITNRVHRTLLSLLSTLIRLCRNTPVFSDVNGAEERAMPLSTTQHLKDNILPEHLVQDTYSRLKARYALELIQRWVEKTDPSKHVFEDLSIAAFLIELWKSMYGARPSDLPGFVDIACGNGVLVYVLIMEGYKGFGFDARVRRTWTVFPAVVAAHLQVAVCIPRPFLEALHSQDYPLQKDIEIHDGIFEADTFIISNHADELTMWTPLLAALSCPKSPLPWLAIPCCSHALSGAAHRYQSVPHTGPDIQTVRHAHGAGIDNDDQPPTGDLKTLRAFKDQTVLPLERRHSRKTRSTYAALVDQVTCLAKRVDALEDVRQTLMRIPSTRNIGILGGQQRGLQYKKTVEERRSQEMSSSKWLDDVKHPDLTRQIYNTVVQECMRSGGVAEAAKTWMVGVQKAIGSTRHTPYVQVRS